MNDSSTEVEVARVTIRRTIDLDGEDSISCTSESPDGEPLTMLEILGLLEFAKSSLILGEIRGEDE